MPGVVLVGLNFVISYYITLYNIVHYLKKKKIVYLIIIFSNYVSQRAHQIITIG